MNRFQFRLDTLLIIRIRAEEQAQISLSAAIKEFNDKQQQLVILKNSLKQAFVGLSLQDKQLTINELQIYDRYIDGLRAKILQQEELVEKSRVKRDEYLKALEAAAQQRKLIEKLKAKRMQEYQKIMLQEEQKIIDELAGQISSKKIR